MKPDVFVDPYKRPQQFSVFLYERHDVRVVFQFMVGGLGIRQLVALDILSRGGAVPAGPIESKSSVYVPPVYEIKPPMPPAPCPPPQAPLPPPTPVPVRAPSPVHWSPTVMSVKPP